MPEEKAETKYYSLEEIGRNTGEGGTKCWIIIKDNVYDVTEYLEEGDQNIDMSQTHLGFPYIINFSNLTQQWLTSGYVRNVRRVKQAPYPLVKVKLEELANVTGRRSFINKPKEVNPQKHPKMIGSSAVLNSTENKKHKKKSQSKSKSGSENPTTLAKTIFHNLNIFGNKSSSTTHLLAVPSTVNSDSLLDADSSSTKSGRRPSLDTVSTYLSQESRDNQITLSTADLLRSDSLNSMCPNVLDFEPSIIGTDPGTSILSRYVRLSQSQEWSPRQMCPICRQQLKPSLVVISLPCNHVLHLDCLNYSLTEQLESNSNLHIQCYICGIIYGEKHGNQPSGIMEWEVINRRLPGFLNCKTIQITYNFQSGTQGMDHPNPGRKYYAVGFPRKAYLPDNSRGRKILQLLGIAWQRKLIFTVSRSHTTGCEDVISWNIPHKTEIGPSNSGHGYPDEAYLDLVVTELKALGVDEGTFRR